MYGVVLHAHPVRGESHNQRNTTGEVATLAQTYLDNGSFKQFLERQLLVLLSMPVDLLLCLTTKIKKMADWKSTFASEHLNTDQSQSTKCFALVACFSPVAVLAILANSVAWANHTKRAKHIVNSLSHNVYSVKEVATEPPMDLLVSKLIRPSHLA